MQRIFAANMTVLVLFLFAAGPAPSIAHDGAKGIVKERMDVMKSIGAAMKTIGKAVRGEEPFDGQKIEEAAARIAKHGARIADLFPASSQAKVSEASPKIWRDFAGFRAGADRLVSAANDVERTSRSQDVVAVKTAFRALGKTCGGCHKQYRIKKKRN